MKRLISYSTRDSKSRDLITLIFLLVPFQYQYFGRVVYLSDQARLLSIMLLKVFKLLRVHASILFGFITFLRVNLTILLRKINKQAIKTMRIKHPSIQKLEVKVHMKSNTHRVKNLHGHVIIPNT